MRRSVSLAAVAACIASMATSGQIIKKSDSKRLPEADFLYDQPDATVPATLLTGEKPNGYNPHVAEIDGALWATWLEYEPDKGDRIYMGRVGKGGIANLTCITSKPGIYAYPALIGSGRQITYEAEIDGDWDLYWIKNGGRPVRLTRSKGPDVRHRTASDGQGGFWIVWQSGETGTFQIKAMHVGPDGPGKAATVAPSNRSQWHPDVAINKAGDVFVVWDGFERGNYDVMLSCFRAGKWSKQMPVANGPGFEGRARVVCDPADRTWILWEEGAQQWGGPFRNKLIPVMPMTDACGPMHRFRELRVAMFDGQRLLQVDPPLEMRSIQAVMQRTDAPEGIHKLGAYYERGQLVVDRAGRVWVIYRHFYAPWLGCHRWTHVEGGYGVYARCLSSAGWSKLYRLDADQRDGLQRLAVTPSGAGIAAVWTTGRTDRRGPKDPRGIHFAALASGGGSPPGQNLLKPVALKSPAAPALPEKVSHTIERNGKRYELYFGDLHRHTDLSLCFVPLDGTLDDAYRYAIDPGGLDFFGITDHTRDIDRGQVKSLLWWRCRKEVNRHHLPGRFFPMFSYERSKGGTADENVISLRPDMLRPYTYPVPEFWEELDDDTFTIPHQPIRPQTWDYHDERRRPLAEIYQGCRDNAIEADLMAGLKKGYKFGLICSSDHLSTNVSFAAVYSPGRDRESIFRSMQARRTYGATAKIVLDVRAGEHLMGESFAADRVPTLTMTVRGTAPIKTVRLYRGQKLHKSWDGKGADMSVRFEDSDPPAGGTYYMFWIEQVDGHRAWSSPIWITLGEKGKPIQRPARETP